MNRQLAQAVISSFRPISSTTLSRRLSKFSYRSWKGIYNWLDASGLALYFLDRLKDLHLESAVPPPVLHRLESNAADNREKTNLLFEEFMEINREFKKAGLLYANLKGFTLTPDAVAEASLRCQLDLDFLIAPWDLPSCAQILQRRGYLLVGAGDNVQEFKAGNGSIPSLKDLYKPKPDRCVEIHFSNFSSRESPHLHDDRLLRLGSRLSRDLQIPLLSDCDRFIELACHLFKHMKGEWTRVAWILEYVKFVKFNEQNEALWLEVERHMSTDEEIALAVGAATLISQQILGIPELPEVLGCAILRLPQLVRLWIELYGARIIMAKFPGTKLYLLLHQALASTGRQSPWAVSERLVPMRRPASVTVRRGDKHLLYGLRRMRDEIGYFFFASGSTWNRIVAI